MKINQPENLLKTIEMAAQLKVNLKLDQKQVQQLHQFIQDLQDVALCLTSQIHKEKTADQ